MPIVALRPETSLLVVLDLQPAVLRAIDEADRVVTRSSFLAGAAKALDVPILVTEQVPAKMGATHEALASLAGQTISKSSFSCAGNPEFMSALQASGRKQVVIVGIETHICVALTAQDLLLKGYEVVVCPDAVSSSTLDRHKLGMERIRDAGAVPAHSEAVAYEWMKSAEHPAFRTVLSLVKASKA